MANIESKNTVRVEDQEIFDRATFFGKPDGSPRILIMGNSVTRHQPLPSIGWENDWGMAASSKEKDYAHLVIAHVMRKHPNAAFCILQAAIWEQYFPDFDFEGCFAAAADFHPDIIVCAISANIKAESFEHEAFIREMGRLHRYLAGGKDFRLIQTTSFFDNAEKTAAIREYVATVVGDLVEIHDLCHDEENLAIGRFWHEGIEHHPGDLGMMRIAERITEKLDKYL